MLPFGSKCTLCKLASLLVLLIFCEQRKDYWLRTMVDGGAKHRFLLVLFLIRNSRKKRKEWEKTCLCKYSLCQKGETKVPQCRLKSSIVRPTLSETKAGDSDREGGGGGGWEAKGAFIEALHWCLIQMLSRQRKICICQPSSLWNGNEHGKMENTIWKNGANFSLRQHILHLHIKI